MKLKRDNHCDKGETSSSINPFSPQKISSQANMWEEDDQQRQQQEAPDAGMDELLAEMGYKVKSSDMDEVAQKLEQLDKVMGTSMEDGKNGISHLSDTVHYNPSDLSGWVQSMLSELNNNVNFPISSTSNIINYDEISAAIGETDYTTRTPDMIFDDDLRAIPGDAIFFNNNNNNTKNEKSSSKRMKSSSSSPTTTIGSDDSDPRTSDPARPVVLMDSQETGIRLVHTLMACAEAVQQHNFKVADALIKHIGLLAVSQVGAMRKVATYFAEALARRIYKIYPQVSSKLSSESDILQMHFYESCPYLKFAHFTANQAILEAFTGANRVHVIDFALKLGMQWPALLQALALRPGGPPAFRLTGIGPPQPDNTDALQQVGWKLAQLAETIGVEFEFRGYVANSLADIDASMLEVRSEDVEAVAVNSVFELHRLLSRPGRIEKVLNLIKSMKPKIVAIVEQEANHNGNVFLDRFNEALHYYSTMFDSLESSGLTQQSNSKEDLLMSEVYLGQQICNVLACEGADRVERHETLAQWRGRMNSAGFEPVHLGSNAFKQASMLLALFGRGDGYRVEENDGCLMLGWHTRPLIATSAWQIRDGSESL